MSLFKKFKANTDGNMAITFSVALLMVMAVVGAALDFTTVQSLRSKMQDASDMAVLAAARSGETSQAALQDIAKNLVLVNDPTGDAVTTTLSLTNNKRVRVKIAGQYKTQIMGMFGRPTVAIDVVSEAPIGESIPVDIALVLDTTGSMRGAKLASLKTAANNLITMLEGQAGGDVKVSVVPFAQYVNIGTSNAGQSWINTSAGWSGCAGSRMAPWDMRVNYGGSPMQGINGVNCSTELLPLSSNLRSVRAKINSFTANGWTYIPGGLAWGWRTLNSGAPFTQARASASNTRKVMIVMTDGANTKSKNGIYHNGNNYANANAKTTQLCNGIKNDTIELYTIAFQINHTATKTLMQNCASDASMYFDAGNSAQLNAAFQDIGRSLIKLRLTH